MTFKHKHDHTITYKGDVIKYSDGSYIYYIEGLGAMDPELWETTYEPVKD